MSQCRTHPESTGVNTCNKCGDWLCESCTVEINGRNFCRKCLAALAAPPGDSPGGPHFGGPPPGAPPFGPPPPHPGTVPPPYPGAMPPPPHPTPPYRPVPPPGAYCAYTGKRYISGAVLALLTCFLPIPGVNYMYEGLIKRGLAAMGGFFMIIYAISVFHVWPFSLIFGLAIPIYWLACLFDSVQIRRRINAGEIVNDDIDDMLGFVRRNRRAIMLAVFALLAMGLTGSILSAFAGPLRRLLPFLVIICGLQMLFNHPPRGRGPDGRGQ